MHDDDDDRSSGEAAGDSPALESAEPSRATPSPGEPGQVDASLVEHILEAGQRELELRERMRELVDEDRAKDEFLAMLAHELRNPLAPIRNAVAVLRLRNLDDAQVRWATELIGRQVDHLRRLLDDLLDVGRVTRGKIKLDLGPIDLHPVLDHAFELCQPHVQARGHTLQVDVAADPLPLHGDADRLTQVFANILINAAKYTEPGGVIRLAARTVDGGLCVSVRDTGHGIAPELLPRIFEPFVQGRRTLDRAQGGLGVGLTLAKRLIEMHGGTIEARNASPGAEFMIRLPGRPALPEAVPRVATGNAAQSATRGAAPRRVLVVDDNADAGAALVELLRLEGHDAHVAFDGEQALDVADGFHPDVLVLDIGLPGIDGRELARRFRAREDTGGALIVAVSGYGNPEDLEASAAAGFDLHLVKPVNPAAIEDAMARALRPGSDRMH